MSDLEISLCERRKTAVRMELQTREPEYRRFLADWGASARQTRAGDRAVVSEAVEELYRTYGARCPKVVWCRGPQQALRRIRKLAASESLGDDLLPPGFQLGELNGGWLVSAADAELWDAIDQTWTAVWNGLWRLATRRALEGRGREEVRMALVYGHQRFNRLIWARWEFVREALDDLFRDGGDQFDWIARPSTCCGASTWSGM